MWEIKMAEYKKKALISGASGQDASYLAELLLDKGYEVFGTVRRIALQDQDVRTSRINHIKDKMHLIPCDLNSYASVFNAVQETQPDECYHLAAQSFVKTSFDDPFETYATNFMGTINLLEALKKVVPKSKFYFAATSEMFGKVVESPQKETTPFNPRSPYGIAKTAGYFATKLARDSGELFACSGILFNHCSPRRGLEFVTQKIVCGLKDIKDGKKEVLELGNMDARRDWGFSGDYVKAMWMMLQQPKPDDYVIATGETNTVRKFVELSAKRFGYDLEWKGEGIDEIGIDRNTNKTIVKINPEFYRPAEVDLLLGDASKARKVLGWKPEVKLEGLVNLMVDEIQ